MRIETRSAATGPIGSLSPQTAPQQARADVGIRIVGPTGDMRIDGLLTAVAWNGAPLTYSTPDAKDDYGTAYHEPLDSIRPLTAEQVQALHFALDTTPTTPGGVQSGTFSFEALTGVGVSYTAGGSGDATMRYVNSDAQAAAYGYFPDAVDPRGGDAFFGGAGRTPVQGNADYLTILHEVGHTLGLKHAHDTVPYGAVPAGYDAMEYTVMSYRSSAGGPLGYLNEPFGFAQTYMMLDIAALQHMYGANYATNAGNTVYTWDDSDGSTYVNGVRSLAPGDNRIFMTIWDGGGTDTYDLGTYASDLEIDLTPGGHSQFVGARLAYLGSSYAQGNVYNALLHEGDTRSLIENVVGGTGNDLIVGNQTANAISAGAGNDTVSGAGGNDILEGGSGDDMLDGGTGDDAMAGGAGNDTYAVDSPADRLTELPNQGLDTVIATVAHTLGDNFENLTLVGNAATLGTGNALANRITGNQYGNTLVGGGNNDTLVAGSGADVLRGGDGDDKLIGGLGADVLIGGTGRDTFDFDFADHSTSTARDILRTADGGNAFLNPGAAAGDLIDVSGIDADETTAANQAFTFGGSGVASLSVTEEGSNTLVRANTDRDPAFEFVLLIEDGQARASAYTAADFVL